MTPRKQVTYSSHPNHAARAAHKAGERAFKTYDTSHIRPKKSKAPLVVAAILAVFVLGGLAWGAMMLFGGSSGAQVSTLEQGQSATVVIPEGSGAKAIGTLLQDGRVIADANEFVTQVTKEESAASLKPGTYVFVGPLTLNEVIKQLVAGPTSSGLSLVIPEGYTIDRTAAAVEEATQGAVTAVDFTAAANNAVAYEADFPFVAGAYNGSLEGFLFPKTYPLDTVDTADSLIRQMLTQYKTETAALDYTYAASQGLTPYNVLVLASIIEREADNNHRAAVSSVFYNRLAIDMPLQSDATTAYALGGVDPTPEDLQVPGPFNSYLNKGLPEGPICSPGLASLQAACAPDTSENLYFYFKEENGEMKYYFSKTYEDHNTAIFS